MPSVNEGIVNVLPSGLVTRKDAAKALGKSPKTLCEWSAEGFGPKPRKVGGRIFYDWSEVMDFIDNAPRR